MRLKNNKLVLTISYGNYTEGNGGTDKVLLAHQEMFNQAGISMFHLYPIHKVYDKVPEINLWGLIVDGVYKGMYVTEQILRFLKKSCSSRITFKAILIHHFNGIQIEEIHKLLSNIDAHIFFYLHDYMSICPDAGLVALSRQGGTGEAGRPDGRRGRLRRARLQCLHDARPDGLQALPARGLRRRRAEQP